MGLTGAENIDFDKVYMRSRESCVGRFNCERPCTISCPSSLVSNHMSLRPCDRGQKPKNTRKDCRSSKEVKKRAIHSYCSMKGDELVFSD